MIAMLVYLAHLVQYGHIPGRIGTVRIGKYTYLAGEYDTAPLHQGSVKFSSERRMALIPPGFEEGDKLLPASYRRTTRTMYQIDGLLWYIAGYNEAEGVIWLAKKPSDSKHLDDHRTVFTKTYWWPESYDDAIRMTKPELVGRGF